LSATGNPARPLIFAVDEVIAGIKSVMRAPALCDESGVGFAARLAGNSTLLWSHHSILRNDETWLPKWSGDDFPLDFRRSVLA
jgi:hypothetical protein